MYEQKSPEAFDFRNICQKFPIDLCAVCIPVIPFLLQVQLQHPRLCCFREDRVILVFLFAKLRKLFSHFAF